MPFIHPDDMLTGSPLPGWNGRFFHSENMTFAYWDIDAGATDLHNHQHGNEEVWHIIEGEATLTVGNEERRVTAGEAAVIPPDTPHSVKLTGPCRAIVADYPLRLSLPGMGQVQPAD